MARPTRNGVAERSITTPRDAKAKKMQMTRSPVGTAPKDLAPDEKKMWDKIVAECQGIDKSHRQWVRATARILARVDCLANFFQQRTIEFTKQGIDPALAFLCDETGKRHPLMADLLASEEGLRKQLNAMGASRAAQSRLMSDVGEERKNIKDEEMRKRYLKGNKKPKRDK